jgi:predicted amidophosphoribosyltransferase
MNDKFTHALHNQSLADCVASWPQLPNGLRYQHLVDYHSYTGFGTYNLSPEEWDNREMIFNFKNNSELTDPISHRQAMEKAIDLFTTLLQETFGSELPLLTLTCVPASTATKTEARFKEFAALVTQATGMTDGYEHIHVVADQDPEHLGESHLPKYAISQDFFAGRPVLLFDDIMATGSSLSKFANNMREAGAEVVSAVVLGKTVSHPTNE